MALPRDPRRLATGIVLAVAIAAVVVASAACGKTGRAPGGSAGATESGPAASSSPDLSTPVAALGAAADALAAGDLAALDACLTPQAAQRVRRDLLAWKALLADPAGGPRALARIPSPAGDAEKAAYRAGFGGDPAGLLRMLARATSFAEGASGSAGSASAAKVEVTGPVAGDRVEGDRVLPDGTRRRAVLVRRDGAWRVDRLAL